MAGDEISLPLTGNLTADPELRFTQRGTPVANFTVASTPRNYDRQNSEWRDGETTFMKCTAWRELAENIAESFVKGSPVIVVGKLVTKSYTTREGDPRRSVEMEAENVGPNLRYGTAQFTKHRKGGNGGSGQATSPQPDNGGGQQQSAPVSDDPWGDGGGASANDDPWA